MDKYKIVKKGVFQSLASFQDQLNGLAVEGWKAVSISNYGNTMHVLLERIK